MTHVEDDTLTFSPIRQNINSYAKEDKNWGDNSSTVLLDDGNLCDTVIADNTYISSNRIPEIQYLVLSFIPICGDKYSIYSRKTETATNIIILKNTESIEYTNILEVNCGKVLTYLLINTKCIVTVGEPGTPFRNIPHSTRLVLCETNVRDYQYKTK